MAIRFGSPEALAILEADRQQEGQFRLYELIARIQLANGGLKHLQAYFEASDMLDTMKGRLDDLMCDLRDAVREVEEEAAGLPEGDRHVFIQRELDKRSERREYLEAEKEAEDAEREFAKAISDLILPAGLTLEMLDVLDVRTLVGYSSLAKEQKAGLLAAAQEAL